MLTEKQPQIQTDEHRKAVNEITESIIGCAFRVANILRCGFLEKVYENAMSHELTKRGMVVRQQAPLTVHYDDTIVGHYTADLLVDDQVIVELKAVKALDEVHMAQCLALRSSPAGAVGRGRGAFRHLREPRDVRGGRSGGGLRGRAVRSAVPGDRPGGVAAFRRAVAQPGLPAITPHDAHPR